MLAHLAPKTCGGQHMTVIVSFIVGLFMGVLLMCIVVSGRGI